MIGCSIIPYMEKSFVGDLTANAYSVYFRIIFVLIHDMYLKCVYVLKMRTSDDVWLHIAYIILMCQCPKSCAQIMCTLCFKALLCTLTFNVKPLWFSPFLINIYLIK